MATTAMAITQYPTPKIAGKPVKNNKRKVACTGGFSFDNCAF
jgi:hypothetical protein